MTSLPHWRKQVVGSLGVSEGLESWEEGGHTLETKLWSQPEADPSVEGGRLQDFRPQGVCLPRLWV